MSKEDVLICDRCDTVIRGVVKSRDAKSDLIVHVRADIGVLTTALSEVQDSNGSSNAVEAKAFSDLCDTCRDDCAELVAAIFKKPMVTE